MKESDAFKEWQRDLIYLSAAYDITSGYDLKEPVDVFAQIFQAASLVPDELEKAMKDSNRCSLSSFLKSTAGSLVELHNLLKITLNLDLISISEYHSLTKSLYEIGEIIKKVIIRFNKNLKDTNKKINLETGDFALWTLN